VAERCRSPASPSIPPAAESCSFMKHRELVLLAAVLVLALSAVTIAQEIVVDVIRIEDLQPGTSMPSVFARTAGSDTPIGAPSSRGCASSERAMFSESAALYDKIYINLKNYRDEARNVGAWIKRLRPDAQTVLDVACGTGEHDRFLSADYRVDGIDLNPEFVRIAKTKNPAGDYRVADMSNFDLNQRYDVIVCLFSSIGYVQTTGNLHAALASFHRHLNAGGIVLVEPWFTPEGWNKGILHIAIVDEDQLKVCRMNISEVKSGRLSFFTFHYLVGTPQGVAHFTEDHTLGLFTLDEMKAAFEATGLNVQYDDQGIFGRGLYIAER
jgi:SAM-dependent methyltransferase